MVPTLTLYRDRSNPTSMQVLLTPIPDVKLIDMGRHGDRRGWFTESWNAAVFAEAGLDGQFIQDNLSFSAERFVVRGLHYQLAPLAQTKLVRVITGAILDVAVDLRCDSPTFGLHVAVELDAQSGRMLWVPKGFAHGFCTLTPDVHLLYKVDARYSPAHERIVRWNDPELGIAWPVEAGNAILSTRDAAAPSFRTAIAPEQA